MWHGRIRSDFKFFGFLKNKKSENYCIARARRPKSGAAEVRVIVTKTESDAHLLELAIERNATHGLQLSQADKEKMAGRLYGMCVYKGQKEREERKAHLTDILSVSVTSIQDWTSRTDRNLKAELRQRAFNLWMSFHTQDQIADEIGYSAAAIRKLLDTFRTNAESGVCSEIGEDDDDPNGLGTIKFSKAEIAAREHATDFTAPLYNIWKQQEKTAGSSHFGNSNVRWANEVATCAFSAGTGSPSPPAWRSGIRPMRS